MVIHLAIGIFIAPYQTLVADARAFANAVRAHWGVENRLHWVLDITFREDESRIRRANAPANFNTIRQFALNLLKRVQPTGSVKQKKFNAALDDDFRDISKASNLLGYSPSAPFHLIFRSQRGEKWPAARRVSAGIATPIASSRNEADGRFSSRPKEVPQPRQGQAWRCSLARCSPLALVRLGGLKRVKNKVKRGTSHTIEEGLRETMTWCVNNQSEK